MHLVNMHRRHQVLCLYISLFLSSILFFFLCRLIKWSVRNLNYFYNVLYKSYLFCKFAVKIRLKEMDYQFETIMQVRDYECDIQGIVNNANYMHYAEHTRHMFLRKYGVSFSDMHDHGEDAVVARVSMQYKTPLMPENEFRSCLNVKREGLRYVFYQDFYRLPDNKICFRAQFETVFLVNGRLANSPTCDKAFAEFFEK